MRVHVRARLRALGRRTARSATSTLTAVCDAQLAEPPEHARVVVASNCFPTGHARLVRAAAGGGWSRGRADGDVARPALPSGRRRAARRHESARDRDPELGRQAAHYRRLDGRRHARRRPSRRSDAGGTGAVRRREGAQGVRARARARPARRRARRRGLRRRARGGAPGGGSGSRAPGTSRRSYVCRATRNGSRSSSSSAHF